jgi:FkbM family methyltransferase
VSEEAVERVARLAEHLDRPLVVVDVGCRDGEATGWTRFGQQVHVIGFEPDAEECERLRDGYDGPARRTFVPHALGSRRGEALLHVTRFAQSSSLYEPSTEAIDRHPALTAHAEVDRRTVSLDSLDEWVAETDGPTPDFLKLDVQGAELDVLRGSERALESVRALEVEVEFQPLYRGQPLFADVDAHLRERGFVLWRLRGLRHLAIAGAAPDDLPMGASVLPDQAELLPAGGRLSWGDAIYVRDDFAADRADGWTAALRDACVATAIGLPELARVALARAAETAPATAVRTELEQAREQLAREGRGRPEQAISAVGANAETIDRLTRERDQARDELQRLRAMPRPVRVARGAARRLRALGGRSRR